MSPPAGTAVRVCLAIWALASILWALLASVPLHQPDAAALSFARGFGYDLPMAMPDGHRIIDSWWLPSAAVCITGFALLLWRRTWAAQAAIVTGGSALVARHRELLIVLTCAFVARFALAYRGGQYFDWDEARYGAGAAPILLALSHGDWHGAMDALFRLPTEHVGFRIVGLLPALLHTITAWWNGRSLMDMNAPAGEWVAAGTLSIFSVAVIAEVYWLASKLGAERREALAAAMLATASTTLILYSRHLFPYDASLAIAFAGLGIALGERRRVLFFISGVLAGFAFLVYNGYWMLVPIVGMTVVLFRRRSWPDAAVRLLLFGCGAAAIVALFLFGNLMTSPAAWQDTIRFSATVVNGDFDAGAKLPWQFFWHAEHSLLVLWGIGIAVLIFRKMIPGVISPQDADVVRRGRFWLIVAALCYLFLVIPSNVLHKFVVYDRSVRPLVPLLCLATASAAMILTDHGRRGRWLTAAGALLVVHVVWNAAPLYALRFPREVSWWATSQFGDDVATGARSFVLNLGDNAGLAPSDRRRYVVVNDRDIWIDGDRLPTPRPIPGRLVYRTTHPRQLFIYQYHGYKEELRRVLRRIDLSTQVIDRGR